MPVFSAGDFMYGNVDNNSKVDVADTIQLLRYIVGLGTLMVTNGTPLTFTVKAR